MPHYEVTAYKRITAAAAAPTFEEVGPITQASGSRGRGSGLSYSFELFGEGSIEVATSPDDVTQGVAECLVNMETMPMEVAVFRDGILMQRGPLVAWQVEGTSLVLHARGLLYYLRYMTLTTDESYNTNQVLIAKSLIDKHQAKTRGNFGLVTTSMTSAGATREREYLASDLINVHDEIRALGEADNGFDMRIDPETRVITCHNPQYGTDKSELVSLDQRGIVNPGISDSVVAGQFGSAAFVAGVVNEGDDVTSESIDTATRDAFGLAYVTHTASGVGSTTEIGQVAVRTRDMAKRSVFLPSKEFFAMPDADVFSFDVGDTISSEYNAGFSPLTYIGRVKNKFVSVQEGGQDKLTVEFV